MLDNIIYWDGCPDSYKERIPELIKELETTKPVNVDLADVSELFCDYCMMWTTKNDKCDICNNDKLIADNTH